jgi:hypothetical protein
VQKIKLVAAGFILIESIFLAAVSLYMVVLGFTHDKDWLPYLSVISFAFSGSVALLALALGIRSEKRWANSPAILANLIALGVAKYQFEAGAYHLAIPITIVAVTVIVSLLVSIRNLTR